jgi:hypothetical protein
VIRPDDALLLTGGYSPRDRGEEQVPFIVEQARPLGELRGNGDIAVALCWSIESPPDRETARAAAALCAAHPGPAPLLVEWSGTDGNGGTAQLRSRTLRVDAADELVSALRALVGAEHVRLKAVA